MRLKMLEIKTPSINLKHISLISLVLQTVFGIFLLRLSKIQHPDGTDDAYLTSVALIFSEIFKLLFSVYLLFAESINYTMTINQLVGSIFSKKFLISGVPAAIYQLQNYLLFVALDKLPAGIYHASYQMKIFSTAIFSILLLANHISIKQWMSLVGLVLGVSIIQLSAHRGDSTNTDRLQIFRGLLSVMLASLCSGFAGVFSEKLIKRSKQSPWLQSIHFASYGLFVSAFIAGLKDSDSLIRDGMFKNFSFSVWLAIVIQSIGGIIIIMILKYADNIMKCLANSISIIITSLISVYIFKEATASLAFCTGVILVVGSVFYYNFKPNFKQLQPLDKKIKHQHRQNKII